MILSELRDYLKDHKRAALFDIALHFDSNPDAIRGMLEVWVKKGRVRKLPQGTSCSGCCECDPSMIEIYEWTA
jgi:putative ferrous iron transport protein C